MIAVLLWLTLVPAVAQDDDNAAQAERLRVRNEIAALASRNAWTGVERGYQTLVDLGVPLSAQSHLLGAQAASARGDILLSAQRLSRIDWTVSDDAETEEFRSQAEKRLSHVATRFRLVHVTVGPDRVPALLRPDVPFATEERLAVDLARARLQQTRSFRGLLPVGDYSVDGESFTVDLGDEWLSVVVP